MDHDHDHENENENADDDAQIARLTDPTQEPAISEAEGVVYVTGKFRCTEALSSSGKRCKSKVLNTKRAIRNHRNKKHNANGSYERGQDGLLAHQTTIHHMKVSWSVPKEIPANLLADRVPRTHGPPATGSFANVNHQADANAELQAIAQAALNLDLNAHLQDVANPQADVDLQGVATHQPTQHTTLHQHPTLPDKPPVQNQVRHPLPTRRGEKPSPILVPTPNSGVRGPKVSKSARISSRVNAEDLSRIEALLTEDQEEATEKEDTSEARVESDKRAQASLH
ncbi:hypothetical protein GGR53DRAFT_470929 [Hypoxylon sp. FL1150]|nr:hypothetical protein GGR53DRAFT_470929 [Hypoxylon sp. FL1150]